MSAAPAKHLATKPVAAFQNQGDIMESGEEKFQGKDPRFSSTANKSRVRSDYNFILEKRLREKQELEIELKQNPDDEDLKRRMLREKQKIGEIEARNREHEILKTLADAETAAVREGKERYYMPKRDLRRAVSASQFVSQRERGRAAEALKRRGRRVAK